MKRLILAVGLIATLGLQACTTVTLAPAGPYKAGANTTYSLGQPWNDYGMFGGQSKGVRLLTLDGPLLNRLYLSEGIKDGGSIQKSFVKERPTPVYRKGSSATELVEFVADSVEAMGYEGVETSGIRRAEVAGRQGIQFDLMGRTPNGLNIKGLGQVLEVDGLLYVALYLAPEEHYFEANLSEVKGILASLRI